MAPTEKQLKDAFRRLGASTKREFKTRKKLLDINKQSKQAVNPVSARNLLRFIKSNSLDSSTQFVKSHKKYILYQLASEVLESTGRNKSLGQTYKEHCGKYHFCFVLKAIKAKDLEKKMSYPVCHPNREPTKQKTVLAMIGSVAISSDSFLSTYEWRVLRMKALRLHGARCQCCGISPKEGAIMNVDHIKPRKLFPDLALSLENLQILCGTCNQGKGNWDMTDWRPKKETVTLKSPWAAVGKN